jgi:probable rRNA maturation factor
MIEVTVSDMQSGHQVDQEQTAAFVALLAAELDCTADEVSVALVDEERIRGLNRAYRGIDRVTDVLSFGLDGEPGPDGRVNLGDLVVCPARARQQAERAGHPFWTELRILLLHGFLHLLGRDHPEEGGGGKSEMEKEEEELRRRLIGD